MMRSSVSAVLARGALLLALPLAACGADDEADAYGNVEATETVVSAEADGRLLAFTAQEGDVLAAGEVVGLVDTTQLSAQREGLLAQRRQLLGQQRSLLAQARASLASRDAALASGDATLAGVAEAEAAAAALAAQLQTAREEAARTQRLYADAAATARELNERQGQVAVLEEQVQQARARTASIRAQAGTSASQARVQAVQAGVPEAQAAAIEDQVAGIDAQLDAIDDRIANAFVEAPVGGTVLTVVAEPGETVRTGSPLFTLADLSSVTLRAYASGNQLGQIRLGMPVEVRVDDGSGGLRAFRGEITAIASEAQFTPTPIQTRDERAELVYAFDVRLANPEGFLKVGMPGEVVLLRRGLWRRRGRLWRQRRGLVSGAASVSRAPASVEVRDLFKRYGETVALGGVSLSVEPGELFGLIGPDGAGKTTLFRILVTVILADAGTATLDGLDVVRDVREIRRRVGYMPGRFSLYPDLTVRENVEFFASVFGTTVEAEYDLIAPIYSQIEPFADRRAGALSGGMKQKLALSCALVHRPRVLVLDEPTTGVDAVSRAEFWDMLAALREGGITTLVSTAYMDEAERCDRIALIQGGPPLARARHARGRRAELRGAARPRPRLWRPRRVPPTPPRRPRRRPRGCVRRVGPRHRRLWRGPRGRLRAAGGAPAPEARGAGTALAVEPAAPTVEDVFMALMGQRDAGYGIRDEGNGNHDLAPASGA